MKTYVALLTALIVTVCGVMMTEADTRTMWQYALFGIAGLTVFVLATGLAD